MHPPEVDVALLEIVARMRSPLTISVAAADAVPAVRRSATKAIANTAAADQALPTSR